MATAFPAKLSTPLRHLLHRYPAASTTISLSSKLTADAFPVAPPQTKPDVKGFISAKHMRSLGRVDSTAVMTTESLAQQAFVELERRRVVNSDDDEEEDDDNIGAVSGDDEFDDVFDEEFDEEFDDDDEDDDDDDDEKPRRRSV